MALINCPECKKEVSKTAKVCPHCGYKLKKKKGCLYYIGIAILIVIGLVIIELATQDNSSSSDRDFGGERLAYNLSKDYVLQNLKSPKSAKFPGLFESKNHVTDLGGGRYKIVSWVDSKNSFGAEIRTEYSCIMVNKGGDKWGIEELKFDE